MVNPVIPKEEGDYLFTLADLGFPRGGGVNPKGRPTYYLANFFPKTA